MENCAQANISEVLSGPSKRTDIATHRRRYRRGRVVIDACVVIAVLAVAWGLSGVTINATVVLRAVAQIGVVLVPFALIGLLASQSGMLGKSPHEVYRPGMTKYGIDDLPGLHGVRAEAKATLQLFLHHRKFGSLGGQTRRGMLFTGPPGTGKTFLAKAIAHDANVPFLYASATSFHSSYQGATARKVRSFFKSLRKLAAANGGAIGFIDEIDALGAARSGTNTGNHRTLMGGAHTTQYLHAQGGDLGNGLMEMLVQLQSFDSPPRSQRFAFAVKQHLNRLIPKRWRKPVTLEPANILLIGATNRADALDPALVRPGRFDRTLHFDLPTAAERQDLIAFFLRNKNHAENLDTPETRDRLTALTMGASPAMIEHIFDEALIEAIQHGRPAFDWAEVVTAKLTAEVGLAQPGSYTPEEELRVATHEAGHAVVAWLVGSSRKLDILSIRKRRGSLGLLGHSDAEERFTQTETELRSLIKIAFGGMAAEQVFFGDTSTGPISDLEQATRIAATMLGAAGMGTSLISLTAGGGNTFERVLADPKTRQELDDILTTERAAAITILTEHRDLVEALRDALLEHRELYGTEITAVIERQLRSA